MSLNVPVFHRDTSQKSPKDNLSNTHTRGEKWKERRKKGRVGGSLLFSLSFPRKMSLFVRLSRSSDEGRKMLSGMPTHGNIEEADPPHTLM